MTMFSMRAIDYQTKISTPGNEQPSFELLVRVSQGSQIVSCFCCPSFPTAPEVESKSLLMKTPCTLDTEPRGPETYLTWNPPLWKLSFMVLEVTMQASKEWKRPVVLPSYDAYEPQQFTSMAKGAIVAHIPLAVMNSSLVGLKACLTRAKSCLVLET